MKMYLYLKRKKGHYNYKSVRGSEPHLREKFLWHRRCVKTRKPRYRDTRNRFHDSRKMRQKKWLSSEQTAPCGLFSLQPCASRREKGRGLRQAAWTGKTQGIISSVKRESDTDQKGRLQHQQISEMLCIFMNLPICIRATCFHFEA